MTYLYADFGNTSGDGKFYIAHANEILSNGLLYYKEHLATPYYWGYPTFLAACFCLVGENYVAISMFQIFLASLSMTLVFKLLYELTSNKFISFFFPLFYRMILDVWVWDVNILSDSLGGTLEVLTLYCFWRYLKSFRLSRLLLFSLCSVLFFCTRTNAIALLLVLFLYCFSLGDRKIKSIFAALGFLFIMFVICLYVFKGDTPHGLQRRLAYYMSSFAKGEVVNGRPQYNIMMPDKTDGVVMYFLCCLAVFMKRFLFTWTVFFPDHSLVHKLWNMATIGPMFLLFPPSSVIIIKKKLKRFYPFLLSVFSYCIAQSLTELEYDMRYRMPAFILITICCAALFEAPIMTNNNTKLKTIRKRQISQRVYKSPQK